MTFYASPIGGSTIEFKTSLGGIIQFGSGEKNF